MEAESFPGPTWRQAKGMMMTTATYRFYTEADDRVHSKTFRTYSQAAEHARLEVERTRGDVSMTRLYENGSEEPSSLQWFIS